MGCCDVGSGLQVDLRVFWMIGYVATLNLWGLDVGLLVVFA